MGEYIMSPMAGGSVVTSTQTGSSVALDVNVVGGITIGSVSVDVDSIFIQSGNVLVQGYQAHGAALVGSPIPIGGRDSTGSIQIPRLNPDGTLNTNDRPLTVKLDYSGLNTPIYQGWSVPGTANAGSPAWRIAKYTVDGDQKTTDIQWASGNDAFVHIWNDRGSGVYS